MKTIREEFKEVLKSDNRILNAQTVLWLSGLIEVIDVTPLSYGVEHLRIYLLTGLTSKGERLAKELTESKQ